MKHTFLSLFLFSLSAFQPFSLLASTPISGLPPTNSVGLHDELIVNTTNAGTGSFTTKRASIGTLAAALTDLVVVPNPLVNPAFQAGTSLGRMWITNGGVIAYRGQGSDPAQFHIAFTNKNTWANGGATYLTFMGGYNPADVAFFAYLPDHGSGPYGHAPEFHFDVPNGSLAYYYDWIQWGSGGYKPSWHWWISGASSRKTGSLLNTNILDTSFFHAPEVHLNVGALGAPVSYIHAGSASSTLLPAFAFIGLHTNGTGAWVWYDSFAGPVVGTDGLWHRDYDSAVERFRITSGPDAAGPGGAAKLVGTMVADDFRLSTGRPLSNSIVQVGYASFDAGAAVVSTTNIHSTSVVQLSYISTDGTVSALGESLPDRIPGTSFKVLSASLTDANMFSWSIVENPIPVFSAQISPGSVADLLFWYRGDKTLHLNGAMTNWLDSSVNNYTATNRADANEFTPYFTNNAINGKPGFYFLGQKSGMTNGLSLAAGNFTGFGVCRPANNSSQYPRFVDQGWSTDFAWMEATNTTYFSWREGMTTLAAPVPYAPRLTCVRRTGTTLLIKNATTQTTGTLTGEVSGDVPVGIGDWYYSTSGGFIGSICEVIWYERSLSNDEVAGIILFLKAKYGL